MTALTKCNGFVEHLAEKVHDLGADQLHVRLSNTAPGSETPNPLVNTADAIAANITEIAYTNLSTRNITTSASAQASGTYKLTLADLTLTSSGGPTGPFQYVYIVNDTPSVSPVDPIIGVYDYGSALTLNDGESLTLDFDDTNGFITNA